MERAQPATGWTKPRLARLGLPFSLALGFALHLTGCYTASPGVARDVPPYRAANSLTPFGLGKIEVTGKGSGGDKASLTSGLTRVLRTSNFFDAAGPAGNARIEAKILRYSTPPAGMAFTTTLTVAYEDVAPTEERSSNPS